MYVIEGGIKESESCGLLSTCVLQACRAAMPLNHSPYVCGVGGFRAWQLCRLFTNTHTQTSPVMWTVPTRPLSESSQS